jgi:two-component system LytT family response regulator
MERITALIADDEPPARRKVRRFLEADTEIQVVGEARSGAEALESIRTLQPDLVFLDVQMPELDGFGVLEALADTPLPVIVFATAYDEYALRAFDVHAVDYLLKPFDPERFASALARAKERVKHNRAGGVDEKLRILLREIGAERRLDRILVRKKDKNFFLPVAEIDWVESAQNYLVVHSAGSKYIVRGTLAGIEKHLDPERFLRVHRAHIVNIDRVLELSPWSHGDWKLRLKDGTELMLSRRYREKLGHIFEQRF